MTRSESTREGGNAVAVQGYFVPAEAVADDKLFDFGAAWRYILRNRWVMLVAVFMGALLGGVLCFFTQPSYRARVQVQVVDHQGERSGVSSLLDGTASLAAFAGLQLPSSQSRAEALAFLKSHALIGEFIEHNDLLPVLYWKEWDAAGKQWKHKVHPPTLNAGVQRFREHVMTVTEEKDTGLVRLTVDWRERLTAARWANDLVALLNLKMRQRAIASYRMSIEYLQRELAKTDSVELRQAIYRLMQDQMKNAMVAEVQNEYSLRTIDMAVPPDPDDPESPRLRMFVPLGGFVGAIVGLIVAAIRSSRNRARGMAA